MATPVESPREAKLKSKVIWSFWVVILLLGFPTWWATTSIYRAALPTESMLASHDDLWYSIPICLESSSISSRDLADLALRTQVFAEGQDRLFKFVIHSQKQCSKDHISTIFDLSSGKEEDIVYGAQSGKFHMKYPQSNTEHIIEHLGNFLRDAFLEEHAAIAYQVFTHGKSNDKIQNFIQSLPQEIVSEVQKSANRAFKPSSEYHLTFSLFTAGSAPSSWDVRPVLDTYIQPILHALSATCDISVASQVQLYSSFSPVVQPQQGEDGWRLRKADLTSFVNTAEWPLSPSIGAGPTVNFIAYVPAKKFIPLLLEDTSIDSWLVPNWGGITILNPPLQKVEESQLGLAALPAHLDREYLDPAFQNFQAQLLQLLGVPHATKLPIQERLKAFQRLSGLSLYMRTSSNLGSLARLAQHLSSIPIPRHVLTHVENALDRLSTFRQCFDYGSPSNAWSTCLASAKEAFIHSEKAFFDKSMVGQVYFPDEHKVAVYLPLLGPVGVPLVVGLIRELKSMAARRKP